ncbi:MAG: NYN domain-containing protein [Armatimonadota bacterium]
MDECVILVDNTNLFIGGQKLSAKRKGVNGKNGNGPPKDPSWRLDFEGLRTCLANGREVHAAVMVGSAPAESDCVWEDAARDAGFDVVVHDRAPGRGEKAVDTELVARGTEIICSTERPMVLVLASGDRDYVPLAEVAHRHGWSVELCAFRASFSEFGDLAETSDVVRELDDCFDQVGMNEYPWPENTVSEDEAHSGRSKANAK